MRVSPPSTTLFDSLAFLEPLHNDVNAVAVDELSTLPHPMLW
jgi:hypothetical protein